MIAETGDTIVLTAQDTSLVLACGIGARPSVLYWGAKLTQPDPALLAKMTTRQHAPGSADAEVPASLMNGLGAGGRLPAGLLAHRNGQDWAADFSVTQVRRDTPLRVEISCSDPLARVRVVHLIEMDAETGLVTFETALDNQGEGPLTLDWCAAACLPLDPRLQRLFGFSGRWASEFQIEEIDAFTGTYLRENKSGRTGHDSFPGLVLSDAPCHEQNGLCFGFHLGWSGNSRMRVDRLHDGRASLQMGELFLPGEMRLSGGETYQTPPLYAACAQDGFSALSRKFHDHLRAKVMADRISRKPRPIHYNTWEAVYFDHDPDKLRALAEKAAEVGAERFILDDGWFGGRRNDRTGLGDWWASEDVYPEGLGPLINHVTGLGMEFGLWFEPEMVNPDSHLYRDHPDWVLQIEGQSQVPSRGQYVLDLTRPEVCDYLFDKMHNLLNAHAISYIKWDMNRDLTHPGSQGRAATHKQTRAVYGLIERLHDAHPDLEIESCASGGGRADYGILQQTDRIWTSDSNDALDRQRIQRGASYFFPLQIMGAHVGPETCHITGRRLSMELRVATALFGHMGMELNLLEIAGPDLAVLKAGLALHKKHRDLIHSGDFFRLETPSHVNAVGVVAKDRSEALVSWCNLTGHRETLPGRLYLPELNPERAYRTKIAWPQAVQSVSSPSVSEALDLAGQGSVLSGESLTHVGLQVPLLYPETGVIYHFVAEGSQPNI